MSRVLRTIGCITALIFGATLVEAAWFSEGRMPKRVREEFEAKRQEKETRRATIMTPEERLRREERTARIKARVNQYIVNPFKKLRPRRHPEQWRTESKEEAAARRRERLQGKLGGLVPHRYPKGYSTDPARSEKPFINVEPANYPVEKVK